MMPHTALTAERINQVIKLLPHNPTLIWDPSSVAMPIIGPYGQKNSNHVHGFLKEYDYSVTALINLLCAFDNYQEAVDEHRNTKDAAFYIKRQLSWIGKTYDETQWLGYWEFMKKLEQYLQSYLGKWIIKQQQIDFRNGFKDIILDSGIPEVEALCDMYRAKDKLPGLKKLNDILKKLSLPYIVQPKQSSGKSRCTKWCICQK